jgi:MFS family permease
LQAASASKPAPALPLAMPDPTNEKPGSLFRLVAGTFVYIALLGAATGMPGAILIIYLQARGFSLATIAIAATATQVTAGLLEVPTGVLADRVSRKGSLVASAFLFVLVAVGYFFATRLAILLGAAVLSGVVLSLESGTMQAFLFDTLKQSGRAAVFNRVIAGYMATKWYAMLIASLLAALITRFIGMPTVFLAAGMFALGATVAGLMLREPAFLAAMRGPRRSVRPELRTSVAHVIDSFRELGRNPVLVTFLQLRIVFSRAVTFPTTILFQPLLFLFGLPAHQIALAVTGLHAVQAVSAQFSRHIIALFADHGDRIVLAMAALTLAGLSIYAYAPSAGVVIAAAALLKFGNGLFQPFAENVVNDRSGSRRRATLLSINRLAVGLTSLLFVPLFGYIAEAYSVRVSSRSFQLLFLLLLSVAAALAVRAFHREATAPTA